MQLGRKVMEGGGEGPKGREKEGRTEERKEEEITEGGGEVELCGRRGKKKERSREE